MAPGAHQLVVGGDSCNEGDFGLQGLFNADLAVLGTGSHPLATVASNSWEGGTEGQAPAVTEHRAQHPGAGGRRGRRHVLLLRRRLGRARAVQ